MKIKRLILLVLIIFSIQLLFPRIALAFICSSSYRSCDCYGAGYICGANPCCIIVDCPCAGCEADMDWVDNPPGCSGCFTGETEIMLGQESERVGEQEEETKQIKDLKPGDVVSSFNTETGEIKEGTVSDVTKTTREGYYILETESGEKVKVTGEHPFLAVKAKNFESRISPAGRDPASRDNFQLIDKLSNVFSHTLTYRLITGLQTKVSGILR